MQLIAERNVIVGYTFPSKFMSQSESSFGGEEIIPRLLFRFLAFIRIYFTLQKKDREEERERRISKEPEGGGEKLS